MQVFVSATARRWQESPGEQELRYEHIMTAPHGERPGSIHKKGDKVWFPTPEQLEMISEFLQGQPKKVDFLLRQKDMCPSCYSWDLYEDVKPLRVTKTVGGLTSKYYVGMVRIRKDQSRPTVNDDWVLGIVNMDGVDDNGNPVHTFRMIIMNGERVREPDGIHGFGAASNPYLASFE